MDYIIRNVKEEDYDTLYKWFKEWRWPVPPSREVLPDDMSQGVMIEYKGNALCAGFVYATSSSSMFIMEWIISDYQEKDRLVRANGLNVLIRTLIDFATAAGAKAIFTYGRNENLINSLKTNGFIVGSKNSTEMIYNIL